MKVLLVNGYKQTKSCSFTSFHNTLLHTLKTSITSDIPIEIYTKTHKTLDSVLYEMGSGMGFSNRDAAVEFDSYDMVILEGSSALYPWSRYAYKVIIRYKFS